MGERAREALDTTGGGIADPVATAAWERAARVRRAWGEYLGRFAWHPFATLTFERPCTPERARRAFVEGYARRLARQAQRPVPWFYAVEFDALGERPHVHALVAGTGGLTIGQLERAWRHGNTRVLAYDPERGAAFYVCKAIAGARALYDLSRRRPPLLCRHEVAGGPAGAA